MNLYEVQGTYGNAKTPSPIYVAEDNDGLRYYVADGSVNVNQTCDEIEEGVDIETLFDVDMFTAGKPIESLEELEEAINS